MKDLEQASLDDFLPVEISVKGSDRPAVVEARDYERVSGINWHLTTKGYVLGYDRTTKQAILMHRLVMQTPTGLVVDHINFDKLDNRRVNLRNCQNFENVRHHEKPYRGNTTGVAGVHFDKTKGRFKAYIQDGIYKQRTLGYFDTLEEAAAVRQAAELEHYGAFREAMS